MAGMSNGLTIDPWELDGNKFRLCAGLIVFLVSFIPYYSIYFGAFFGTVYWSAWDGFLPFMSLVMTGVATIFAIILVAAHCKQQLWHHVAYIVLYGMSLLCVVMSFFIMPGSDMTRNNGYPRLGCTFGFYIYLGFALAGVITSVRQLKAFRRICEWIAMGQADRAR